MNKKEQGSDVISSEPCSFFAPPCYCFSQTSLSLEGVNNLAVRREKYFSVHIFRFPDVSSKKELRCVDNSVATFFRCRKK